MLGLVTRSNDQVSMEAQYKFVKLHLQYCIAVSMSNVS